jgi:putative acetyltransferase
LARQCNVSSEAKIVIRREGLGDAAAVRRVNESAFGRPDEAELVAALIVAGAAILSLVAAIESDVVGHVLFSPVSVDTTTSPVSALGLAPLAVLPACQRNDVGSSLVRAGLAELERLGHGAVVVLGRADFYRRFGFAPASRFGLHCEFDCPDESFQALELQPRAFAGASGVVRYRPEFAAF